MSTIEVNDAQAHLPELIAALVPGDQLLIVREGTPVATLTRAEVSSWPCNAGSAKDTKHWMAPDFNAPLEDFRECME
jgi:antitoxin (DNA-binding transcriptional repressor) of toxin-antitoxin stability system